ncbi:MAG: BON domain-containing protein [Acidobacteria bacterium]|nr:BON domain-containing protein [Acidobacteriota bacterium]
MTNLLVAVAMIALPALANTKDNKLSPVEDKVRHELVMLPWTSIYDNLSFRVDGDTVTLFGATVRPTMKSSAENVVKRIEGVSRVVNNIEVLPLSPFDDRIRLATARAIYGYPALQRYALGANPSIRIIVKNGNVTLQGAVATEMDRNLAFLRANGVSGSFTVTNELHVDSK